MIDSKDIHETYTKSHMASTAIKFNIVEQKIQSYLYQLDRAAENGIRPFPQTMPVQEFVKRFTYDNSPIGWAHTIFKKSKCQVHFYDERSGFLGLKKTRMAQIVSCR